MDQKFDFDQRLKAARAVYEGTHGMTFNALIDITGFSKQVLRQQAKAEGWRKIVNKGETDEAVQAVEFFRLYREEQNKLAAQVAAEIEAESASEPEPSPNASTETNVTVQTANEVQAIATSVRDEILERHRREWMIPRSLSAEAVRMRTDNPARAFETAKLAKITAETLHLVQTGERKAIGLDSKETPEGHTVVIERRG